MNSPNRINYNKLFKRFESLTVRTTFLFFYNSPFIFSLEPSIIAFSSSLSSLLCNFFFLVCSLNCSTIVSVVLWHLLWVPSIWHYFPLIQERGVVKSAAKEKCASSNIKGIEYVISFSKHTSLNYAYLFSVLLVH